MSPATQQTEPTMLSRAELLKRSEAWADRLLAGPITYFPVRHHSPACARHIARWIEEVRPESIIIEGPKSLDNWIPLLVSSECLPPIAILATYRESRSNDALRHSALYPMCDFSPEWVTLRRGHEIGAAVRFADLEFSDKVLHRHSQADDDTEVPAESMLAVLLADDSNLRYNRFIESVVRRMGCRDFDELWDHLFESNGDDQPTDKFVGTLATYCDLSRASFTIDQLTRDATLAPEAEMVDVIRSEFRRLKKPNRRGAILVVTGGFHTVALPDAVDAKAAPKKAKLKKVSSELVRHWLIRYSYDQLDALSGYRSGMPAPGFYDAIWQAEQQSHDKRAAVARLLPTIARKRNHRLKTIRPPSPSLLPKLFSAWSQRAPRI